MFPIGLLFVLFWCFFCLVKGDQKGINVKLESSDFSKLKNLSTGKFLIAFDGTRISVRTLPIYGGDPTSEELFSVSVANANEDSEFLVATQGNYFAYCESGGQNVYAYRYNEKDKTWTTILDKASMRTNGIRSLDLLYPYLTINFDDHFQLYDITDDKDPSLIKVFATSVNSMYNTKLLRIPKNLDSMITLLVGLKDETNTKTNVTTSTLYAIGLETLDPIDSTKNAEKKVTIALENGVQPVSFDWLQNPADNKHPTRPLKPVMIIEKGTSEGFSDNGGIGTILISNFKLSIKMDAKNDTCTADTIQTEISLYKFGYSNGSPIISSFTNPIVLLGANKSSESYANSLFSSKDSEVDLETIYTTRTILLQSFCKQSLPDSQVYPLYETLRSLVSSRIIMLYDLMYLATYADRSTSTTQNKSTIHLIQTTRIMPDSVSQTVYDPNIMVNLATMIQRTEHVIIPANFINTYGIFGTKMRTMVVYGLEEKSNKNLHIINVDNALMVTMDGDQPSTTVKEICWTRKLFTRIEEIQGRLHLLLNEEKIIDTSGVLLCENEKTVHNMKGWNWFGNGDAGNTMIYDKATNSYIIDTPSGADNYSNAYIEVYDKIYEDGYYTTMVSYDFMIDVSCWEKN